MEMSVFPPPNSFCTFVKRQSDLLLWLFLDFLFCLVALSICPASDPTPPWLLNYSPTKVTCQEYGSYYRACAFPYAFENKILYDYKNYCWGFVRNYIKRTHQFGLGLLICCILSSPWFPSFRGLVLGHSVSRGRKTSPSWSSATTPPRAGSALARAALDPQAAQILPRGLPEASRWPSGSCLGVVLPRSASSLSSWGWGRVQAPLGDTKTSDPEVWCGAKGICFTWVTRAQTNSQSVAGASLSLSRHGVSASHSWAERIR